MKPLFSLPELTLPTGTSMNFAIPILDFAVPKSSFAIPVTVFATPKPVFGTPIRAVCTPKIIIGTPVKAYRYTENDFRCAGNYFRDTGNPLYDLLFA